METSDINKIRAIWGQRNIPVIYRKGKGFPLLLRLPFKEGNRSWLKNQRRNEPSWISEKKYWEIPKAWFNDTVDRCLDRFGSIYIIQPYRIMEKCSPACWNAHGHECQCSCQGANHGSGANGWWFVVSETFAVKWEANELACRLLITK